MRKNSPYTRFFREAIQQLAENGQLGKYRLNASKSRKNCKQPRTKGDALGKWFFKSILENLKVFTDLSIVIRKSKSSYFDIF